MDPHLAASRGCVYIHRRQAWTASCPLGRRKNFLGIWRIESETRVQDLAYSQKTPNPFFGTKHLNLHHYYAVPVGQIMGTPKMACPGLWTKTFVPCWFILIHARVPLYLPLDLRPPTRQGLLGAASIRSIHAAGSRIQRDLVAGTWLAGKAKG